MFADNVLLSIFLAPGDYDSLDAVPLSFSIGAALGTVACADIDIFDDEVVENIEMLSALLTSDDPVILAPIQEANVSIFDNDRKCSTIIYKVSDVNFTIFLPLSTVVCTYFVDQH